MNNPKSNCCNAEVRTDCGDEGTCCYMCNKCDKPCDVLPECKYCYDTQSYSIADEGQIIQKPCPRCSVPEKEQEKECVCHCHQDLHDSAFPSMCCTAAKNKGEVCNHCTPQPEIEGEGCKCHCHCEEGTHSQFDYIQECTCECDSLREKINFAVQAYAEAFALFIIPEHIKGSKNEEQSKRLKKHLGDIHSLVETQAKKIRKEERARYDKELEITDKRWQAAENRLKEYED